MSSSSAPISAAGGGGQQLQSMQVGVMRASNRATGCEAVKLPSHFPPFIIRCSVPYAFASRSRARARATRSRRLHSRSLSLISPLMD